jgi:hypothetical protein
MYFAEILITPTYAHLQPLTANLCAHLNTFKYAMALLLAFVQRNSNCMPTHAPQLPLSAYLSIFKYAMALLLEHILTTACQLAGQQTMHP